jgi:hypothetical protein
MDIEYMVLKRIPHANLPPRSTTALRAIKPMPYRIDIAGTWIDQPLCIKIPPGCGNNTSIEPTIEFNERSGMATSTRKRLSNCGMTISPSRNPRSLPKPSSGTITIRELKK